MTSDQVYKNQNFLNCVIATKALYTAFQSYYIGLWYVVLHIFVAFIEADVFQFFFVQLLMPDPVYKILNIAVPERSKKQGKIAPNFQYDLFCI